MSQPPERLRHRLGRLARALFHHAAWRGSVALASLEPPKLPLRVTRGTPALGRRVVVFCHYERGGFLSEHVRGYVGALVASGLSVVFVTNGGLLQPEAAGWLGACCALLVERPNCGYDFAAWRDGLTAAGLPDSRTELLVIANDSVYGPLTPLDELLARLDFLQADVWGLTDSWQIRYHLQSYFVAFGPAAFRSPSFRSFWDGVRDLRTKRAVIRSYEVNLTQDLLRGGLRCAALWPYVELVRHLGHAPARESGTKREQSFRDALRRQAEKRQSLAAALRLPMNPTAELWRPLLLIVPRGVV